MMVDYDKISSVLYKFLIRNKKKIIFSISNLVVNLNNNTIYIYKIDQPYIDNCENLAKNILSNNKNIISNYKLKIAPLKINNGNCKKVIFDNKTISYGLSNKNEVYVKRDGITELFLLRMFVEVLNQK